jgi:hypothetical protein
MGSLPAMMKDMSEGFATALLTLEEPTKFILDQLGRLKLLPIVKAAHPEAKSYVWWSCITACLYSMVDESDSLPPSRNRRWQAAPAPNGGGDYKKIVDKFVETGTQQERDDLTVKVDIIRLQCSHLSKVMGARNGALECNGTVVKVPGVPDMYDYERELEVIPTPASE